MRILDLRECKIPFYKILHLLEYRYFISKSRKSKTIAFLSIFSVCYKFKSQILTQRQAVTDDYLKLDKKLLCPLQIYCSGKGKHCLTFKALSQRIVGFNQKSLSVSIIYKFINQSENSKFIDVDIAFAYDVSFTKRLRLIIDGDI